MSTFSVTLPNGIKLEGPVDQVISTCEKLGFSQAVMFPEDKYYKSSSKGFVEIKSMATEHIKNAMFKMMPAYFAYVKQNSPTPSELIDNVTMWTFIDKPDFKTLAAMMRELKGRKE